MDGRVTCEPQGPRCVSDRRAQGHRAGLGGDHGKDPPALVLPAVALNYQSEGRMLQLNRAKFSANGNCGYVLKPQCMCQGEGPGHPGRGNGDGAVRQGSRWYLRPGLPRSRPPPPPPTPRCSPRLPPCDPRRPHTLLAPLAPTFSAGPCLTALSPGPPPHSPPQAGGLAHVLSPSLTDVKGRHRDWHAGARAGAARLTLPPGLGALP